MQEGKPDVQHGTTVVAVKYRDMCVIAAERLVSSGFSKTGYIEKLRKINDYVVVGGAGTVGDIQMLFDYVQYYRSNIKRLETGRTMTARSVSKVLAKNSRGAYGEFIVAGKNSDGVGIYLVDAAGARIEVKDDMIATGSGGENAMGVLEDRYKELVRKDKVTDDDLARVAAKAVSSAASRNLGCGGSIDLYLIDYKSGVRKYSDSRVKELLEVS